MKTHTTIGASILAGSGSSWCSSRRRWRSLTTSAGRHRLPDGLAGDEIPLVGRICAVGDVFEPSSLLALKAPWPIDECWLPSAAFTAAISIRGSWTHSCRLPGNSTASGFRRRPGQRGDAA